MFLVEGFRSSKSLRSTSKIFNVIKYLYMYAAYPTTGMHVMITSSSVCACVE
jgi:hypothetical protein